jgi:hypothetical protein
MIQSHEFTIVFAYRIAGKGNKAGTKASEYTFARESELLQRYITSVTGKGLTSSILNIIALTD